MSKQDKTDYNAIIAEWRKQHYSEIALWFKKGKSGAELAAEKLFKGIAEEQGAHEAKRIFLKVAASVKLKNRPKQNNKHEGHFPAHELMALTDMTVKQGGTIRGLARALKKAGRESNDSFMYNTLWGAIDRRIRRLGNKQRKDDAAADNLVKELDAASGL